jgi:hypothetical protein
MENINGKGRASFRRMLSCFILGLAVSASPCFAQENQSASQETQRLQEMQDLQKMLRRQEAEARERAREAQRPFACDSLVPQVCLDIYRRRMEQTPEHLSVEEPRDGSGVRLYGSERADARWRASPPRLYISPFSPRP